MIIQTLLVLSIIILTAVMLKFNSKKYGLYLLMGLITGMLGLFFEESGVLNGYFEWSNSAYFIMHVPIEMITMYFIMGIFLAIMTTYFSDQNKIKPAQWSANASLFVFIFSIIFLFTFPIYGLRTSLLMFILFAGIALFLKIQNPFILLAGAVAGGTEIIFDTVLIMFGGYNSITIMLPFYSFFAVGMFLSGLTIFLDKSMR